MFLKQFEDQAYLSTATIMHYKTYLTSLLLIKKYYSKLGWGLVKFHQGNKKS